MAYKCEICGKGVMFGHNVSHAKNRTKRVFKPNLRQALIKTNGKTKRRKICMKCLKRAKKEGRYILPTKPIAHKDHRTETYKAVIDGGDKLVGSPKDTDTEKPYVDKIHDKDEKKLEEIIGKR